MSEIKLRIGQSEEQSYPSGTTPAELFSTINSAKDAVAASFDDELIDLSSPLTKDGRLEPVRPTDSQALEILRHSTSHIMAEAVRQLYPGVKMAIGPAIANGFYYDFEFDSVFTPEDLPRIETKMAELMKEEQLFSRKVVNRDKAIEVFEKQGEKYKVELIEQIEDDTVSLYEVGDFVDLCRGPHIESSGKVPAFKLLSVSGSYWRGDEKRDRLQRIYGTAFFSRKELKQHLHFLEEAKKRDHRRLGRDLDLFSIHDEAGPGLIIWHPNGSILRHLIENFEREAHLKRGYEILIGPQILKTDLWQTSGHFDNYREKMYFTEVDEISYGIKPMNCLAHMLVYRTSLKSYRDLPKRYFELGTVMRHEKSGVLHGLTRVRQFTQDDAHIICTPDQLNHEIKGVISFVTDVMNVFGFEYEVELSTRPEKSIGTDEDWEQGTNALEDALKQTGLPYEINAGDGAFYGPKIDVHLKDALNRRWQCSTIQCDFTLPERFDLSYIDKSGQKKRPVMIHRTILGSIERFIGVLIEHHAGAFPTWLSPVQARILTVTDRCDEHAAKVCERLKQEGLRVETDLRNEKLGLKIREAQLMKIPYMLVIGDKEVAENGISPRTRKREDWKFMTVENFIERIQPEIHAPVIS